MKSMFRTFKGKIQGGFKAIKELDEQQVAMDILKKSHSRTFDYIY
jgi:hypothetical protein